MMAPEVHVVPADDDRHGAVGAHADEEEGGVLEAEAVVHGEEDAEAGEAEAERREGEEEAVPREVRARRHEHGEGEGGGPGGHRVQLGLDRVVVVGRDDGGGEVGVAVRGAVFFLLAKQLSYFPLSSILSPFLLPRPCGQRACGNVHDEAHVHEPADDDLGVTKDGADVAEGDLALVRVPTQVGLESGLEVGTLLLRQPLGVLGAVMWSLVECIYMYMHGVWVGVG